MERLSRILRHVGWQGDGGDDYLESNVYEYRGGHKFFGRGLFGARVGTWHLGTRLFKTFGMMEHVRISKFAKQDRKALCLYCLEYLREKFLYDISQALLEFTALWVAFWLGEFLLILFIIRKLRKRIVLSSTYKTVFRLVHGSCIADLCAAGYRGGMISCLVA